MALAPPTAPTLTQWAIEAENLSRRYESSWALNRLDLAIPWEQRLALLGANGAGKTTFLRIVATLVRPTSGRMLIGGLSLPDQAAAVRRYIGLVAHQTFLYDELTAHENLVFYGRLYHVANPERRADTLLERVGLTERASHRVQTFSRGLQQRLSLARAIIHDPPILLLDEPDTGLDIGGLDLLASLMNDERGYRRTVLFTTHDLRRALNLADRIVVLSRGQIVDDLPATKADVDTVSLAIRGEGEVG